MAFPDPLANDPEALEAILPTVEVLSPDEAPDVLRSELRRRTAELHAFVASAPEEVALEEVDVARVIFLVGTTRPALSLIAAAIVEAGATIQTIEEVVRWMDVRPVGLNPTNAAVGIDIAYIVAFRALTRPQRWLLHTIAWWAPPPATVSRAHALSVAQSSANIMDVNVMAADLERLIALGFVEPLTLPERTDVALSPITRDRMTIAPYVRYIAQSGLESWPLPEKLPEDVGSISTVQIVALMFVEWGTAFAQVIAGPTVPPPSEAPADPDDADDDAPQMTPEPSLESLTSDELWAALEPEVPHVLRAAGLASELGTTDNIYTLCQLLTPPLRARPEVEALDMRRSLLELGLVSARAAKSQNELLLLATQLADVALDERDLPRAEAFANEALKAALARKDMRAIGFATRRLGAIMIRVGDAERSLAIARQAVALAQANADEAALTESIALLDAAARMQTR